MALDFFKHRTYFTLQCIHYVGRVGLFSDDGLKVGINHDHLMDLTLSCEMVEIFFGSDFEEIVKKILCLYSIAMFKRELPSIRKIL